MFENKTVLITGASGGLGNAIALAFAIQKANLILHYHSNYEKVEKLKKECMKYNIKVLTIKCDLTDEIQIKNMVDELKKEFSKVDVLVNNAGIAIDTIFEEKNKENFLKTLDINLIGPFLLSRYIGNMMYDNKYGKIINISSTNGIDKYYPMCLDYDASKAALNSLTHNLALQYSPYVNVNAVAPGMIATPNEIENMDEEYIKLEEEKIFVKRMGKPEEVAELVLFLASPKSDYINNQVIKIDGGTY